MRLICLALLLVCATAQRDRVSSIIPKYGTFIGASIDFGVYNNDLSAYEAQLKRSPAAYVIFLAFPFVAEELARIQPIMMQIGQRKAIAVVTIEPFGGLEAAQSTEALNALAQQALQWENAGVIVVVRFAHEMNGSWYPWCQRPSAYKYTFALVAEAVKRLTNKATMLWAPNEGGGYPFVGGQYERRCTASDFAAAGSDCSLLDTDGDKQITMSDDCYMPYYPGDTVVDWVGLSVYHFGASWPWGANSIPEPNKFYQKITGTYTGAGGDQTSVPNFYDLFCSGAHGRSKPMIIGETAALYNLCDVVPDGRGCGDGSSNAQEFALKQAWWKEVFAVRNSASGPSIANSLPQIKLINWFDIKKTEAEAQGNTVDWTISRNATIRDAFLKQINQRPPKSKQPYWQFRKKAARASAEDSALAAAAAAAAGGNASPEFAMNQWTVLSRLP